MKSDAGIPTIDQVMVKLIITVPYPVRDWLASKLTAATTEHNQPDLTMEDIAAAQLMLLRAEEMDGVAGEE